MLKPTVTDTSATTDTSAQPAAEPTIESRLDAAEATIKTLTADLAALKESSSAATSDTADLGQLRRAVEYLCGRSGINPSSL